MDVAFEFSYTFFNSASSSEFQSLFLWMLLLNTTVQTTTNTQQRVSILVLMDVAFELILLIVKAHGVVCFNPCSYGCCF